MVFKYLNSIYKLNPKVIHIDFAKSLKQDLEKDNLFESKPIIMHSFFHFAQCIVKYMKKFKIIKSKFSKLAFEILKNIELLCFINPEFIKTGAFPNLAQRGPGPGLAQNFARYLP